MNNTFYIITSAEIKDSQIEYFSPYILTIRNELTKARLYAKSEEGNFIPFVYRVKMNSKNYLTILSNIKISFKRGKTK